MSYESKAKIVTISGTSKATVQVNNNYYSFSYSEERALPENDDTVNIEQERELLWNTLNEEVDKQVEQIVKLYQNN
jgi:hypothetical protein